jgi:hypothetical protein
MNYEKEYKEFSKWWEELTDKNPNWKTLERLAAKDAWMEATKRAEVNGAETNREQALHKHFVSVAVCGWCGNKLCDSQKFNNTCFKCGKSPYSK